MLIDLLKSEYKAASRWTNWLVNDLDETQWNATPAPMNTNINWQIGHILVSNYFHSIISVGANRDHIKAAMPIKEYIGYYTMGASPLENKASKPNRDTLTEHLSQMDGFILQSLDDLEHVDLNEPTVIKNPAAKTKGKALLFAFKHQMWHNGQIAMLKRVVNMESGD